MYCGVYIKTGEPDWDHSFLSYGKKFDSWKGYGDQDNVGLSNVKVRERLV